MTIYVIDDHPLMREAIAMVIRRLRPTHEVIELDRVGLLSAAIEKHGTPSLFSLDLKLPDTTGVSGIRQLKNLFPLVPLAVISANPPSDWEAHCLEAGADVYIDKSAGPAQISALVKGLMLAEDSFEEPVPGQKLSKRQLQLLQLLNKGMSNKEISEELGINEHTVKVHLWRLFRRIEVKSRTQAIFYARQQGLLPL
ncbi:MAG TPA: response regulator transcription factor [Burkholderiaceae bacterium]|nr:response regulator transcription factor [Burkholderiaceae bacterium]